MGVQRDGDCVLRARVACGLFWGLGEIKTSAAIGRGGRRQKSGKGTFVRRHRRHPTRDASRGLRLPDRIDLRLDGEGGKWKKGDLGI